MVNDQSRILFEKIVSINKRERIAPDYFLKFKRDDIRFLDYFYHMEKTGSLSLKLLSADEAESRLERSDVLLILYIPEGFSEKLSSGQPAQLVFRQRGNGGEEGQIVTSLVRAVAERMSQELTAYRQVEGILVKTKISSEEIKNTTQKFLDRESKNPIVEVTEDTVGSRPDPVRMFLPGIMTMFILFAITLNARALVEERKEGTLERLLTTRLTAGELFRGKFLASSGRGFVQAFILLALSYAVFELFTPFSFLEILLVALVFAAAGSVIGLVIASIARTEDQATWIAVFFTMVMVMLGGTFFTIPKDSPLYIISRFSINTHATNAFKLIMNQEGSLANLGPELMIMGGVIIGGLLLSRLLFKPIPGGR